MVARHSMGVGWLRAIQAVLPDQEVALGLPHASSWSPGDTVVVHTHLSGRGPNEPVGEGPCVSETLKDKASATLHSAV